MAHIESEKPRLNSQAKQNLVSFLASAQILTEFPEEYACFLNRVDGGEAKYMELRNDLEALEKRVLATLPEDQLHAMAKQAKHTEVRVVSKGDTRHFDDDWLVDKDTLAYLLNGAIQGKCLMCEDTSGYNCKLRKLLRELPVGRTKTTSVTMACMGSTEEF